MIFNADTAVKAIKANAFDIEEDGTFIAHYKEPWEHRPEGFMPRSQFFANDCAMALAKALGKEWEAKPYDNRESETVRLVSGDYSVMLATTGWDKSRYESFELVAYAVDHNDKHDKAATLKIPAHKTIGQIAAIIRKKVMPRLDKKAEEQAEAKLAADELRGVLVERAEELQAKYPALTFEPISGLERIGVRGFNGDALTLFPHSIHKSNEGDRWYLTGPGMVFDIDTKQGRALLKAFNDAM